MRRAMLLLTVFALAGSLWAADPIIGTWKLNTAKSKDPEKKLTKEEKTATAREVNVDQIEITETGIKTDGTKYSTRALFPKQGGAAIGDKTGSSLLIIIGPGDWCFVVLQNGKQVGIAHAVVSKDGRSIIETVRDTDEKGIVTEMLLVMEKQ